MKDAKLFGIIILTLAVVGLGYYFVPRGEVDITAFSPDNALAQEILTDIEALTTLPGISNSILT